MARPKDVLKWFKSVVDSMRGTKAELPKKGQPPLSVQKMNLNLSGGRVRLERPTRNFLDFSYIMDVLANCPAATDALWQMAQDTALDENGERSAWGINVKVEPLEDTDASEKVASDLRDKLQMIADEYPDTTGIGYDTKFFVHEFLVAGDAFAEQEIDFDPSTGTGSVRKIKMLPTWQMRPVWDDMGILIAYEQWLYSNQSANAYYTSTSRFSESQIRWTIPQQIIHWKNRKKSYMPYGESQLMPLRGRWEQLKLVELDLIVAIHTRAVSPEVYTIGKGGSVSTPQQRADLEQKLKDNPADINRVYVIQEGEVTIEFPKTGDADSIRALLETHRDLENRFIEALGVPGHITGNIEDVAGRHVSNSLDAKYARKVNSLRQDFTAYLTPAVDLEFALRGYDRKTPEKYGVKRISWNITWPDIGESRTEKAKRVVVELQANIINMAMARQQLGYQDSTGIYRQLKAEREIGDVVGQDVNGISNNNNQGPGVGTDSGPENQPQQNTD